MVLSVKRREKERGSESERVCSGAVVTSDVNSFDRVIGYEERVEDSWREKGNDGGEEKKSKRNIVAERSEKSPDKFSQAE